MGRFSRSDGTVTLCVRLGKLADGSRHYPTPAKGKNNRIRPGWAYCRGIEIEVSGAAYYLRYCHNSKSVYRRIGWDLSVALVERQKQEKVLEAIATGVESSAQLIADSTIRYRLRKVRSFFLHFGFDILKRKEFFRFAENVPDTYIPEQLQTLLAACGVEERLRYTLAFGTGMWLGELAYLTRENVDRQRGLITVQSVADWKTKTRRSRRLPSHSVG